MRQAYVRLREAAPYRREAFIAGLRAAGFSPTLRQPDVFRPEDVLVIWNRYSEGHDLATRAEAAGMPVLVAENGYLMEGGGVPKFDNNGAGAYYALARSYHNGNGTWHAGAEDRFARLGVTPAPWRAAGKHVLMLPNRSFGVPGLMMDPRWLDDAVKRYRTMTDRPVVVREHPKNARPKTPVQVDLAGAHCAVVWNSSAGVHALLAGIPVICEAPGWICKGAASTWEDIEAGRKTERAATFHRMAWAQWRLDEIAAGTPFRYLLTDCN